MKRKFEKIISRCSECPKFGYEKRRSLEVCYALRGQEFEYDLGFDKFREEVYEHCPLPKIED